MMNQKIAFFAMVMALGNLSAFAQLDAAVCEAPPAHSAFCGTTSQVIMNDSQLYEGDLKHYFRKIWFHARNVNHPYHNFRHMMHVTWLCSEACMFYKDVLSKRQMRNLLIAALFHDFDHLGGKDKDSFNIARAISGLEQHVLEIDRPYLDDIKTIIQATEFPYKADADVLTLSAQIIRDADLSQSFSPAWLQQVVFGLAAEWQKTPLEVLRSQEAFHRQLKPLTAWGQSLWTGAQITQKIKEAYRILEILETEN